MPKCPRCNTPIDEHEAGRCLDAWVAEAVMDAAGHWIDPIVRASEPHDTLIEDDFVAMMYAVYLSHYSTDIRAAWGVVERVRQPERRFYIASDRAGCFLAVFDESGIGWIVHGDAEADAVPLAICRAAIKAVQP